MLTHRGKVIITAKTAFFAAGGILRIRDATIHASSISQSAAIKTFHFEKIAGIRHSARTRISFLDPGLVRSSSSSAHIQIMSVMRGIKIFALG